MYLSYTRTLVLVPTAILSTCPPFTSAAASLVTCHTRRLTNNRYERGSSKVTAQANAHKSSYNYPQSSRKNGPSPSKRVGYAPDCLIQAACRIGLFSTSCCQNCRSAKAHNVWMASPTRRPTHWACSLWPTSNNQRFTNALYDRIR